MKPTSADPGESSGGQRPGRPEVATSRYVYANRWMRVREDALLRADGSAGLYAVVERPDFAVIVPSHRGALVLVEQYRHALGRRSLEFPQGSHEHAPDRPLEDVARAELAEETGLVSGVVQPLGRIHLAVGLSPQAGDVFLATDLRQGVPRPTVEEQDLRPSQISVPRFQQLVSEGEITDAATLAAWALFLNRFGIPLSYDPQPSSPAQTGRRTRLQGSTNPRRIA